MKGRREEKKKEGCKAPLMCGDHKLVVVYTGKHLTIAYPNVISDNCFSRHTNK